MRRYNSGPDFFQEGYEKYPLRHKDQKGFTLLEIVVALAVMATALLAIYSVLRMCLMARQHSQKLTQAVLLAETQLAEMFLETNPVYETSEGTKGSFRWQLAMVPTAIENLAAVRVEVEWTEQHRPQSFDLLTLRAMKTFSQTYQDR